MRRINTIGIRLTLWGAGITLAVSLLVCGVLYAGVWYSLHHEVDSFLEGEIHEFMGVVREHPDNPLRAEQEIRTHLGSRSKSDLRFRVLGNNGEILIASDPFDPVPGTFLLPGKTNPDGAVFGTMDIPWAGAPLRVCSMRVALPDGRQCVAQASYSLERVESSLAGLRSVAILSLAVAAMLAVLAGRILANRSLAPLHRIVSKSEQISTERLSDRLPRSNNGDEFDRLALVLNDLLDRLEKYVAQLRQFTADASHELRSPLAALRGSAEVVLSRDRTAQELRHVIEESIEHYDRLIRIAEDLLLLARVDTGEAIFRSEQVELRQAVEDVVDLFSPLAAERGLELSFEPVASVQVVGDPGRLRQMISNLLDNAIKYTPASGRINVSLTQQDGSAHLRISDNGVGIESEHLPRVFDRFYRVDRARPRNGSHSAGLGLAICRSIVEAHGGSIALASRPAEGTTVQVVMPVHRGCKGDSVTDATNPGPSSTEGKHGIPSQPGGEPQ